MGRCLLKKILLLFVVFISHAKGSERCRGDDGEFFYCQDRSGSLIAFCCDFDDGYYEECCYYTAVWIRWFCLISGLYRMCQRNRQIKYSRRNQQQPASVQSIPIDRVTSLPEPTFAYNNTKVEATEMDFPPSYQEVAEQGIDDKFRDVASFGTDLVENPVAQNPALCWSIVPGVRMHAV
ncbi:uncharacterized protein LOC143465552 isoform X2 [Clavelina lepadiformis]|uniref:uncharacterized protein LOC143465552 isoform X2 n=1 Tax=Clavelina lepadiformis TaxID=159417 RepID=UPI0040438C45